MVMPLHLGHVSTRLALDEGVFPQIDFVSPLPASVPLLEVLQPSFVFATMA